MKGDQSGALAKCSTSLRAVGSSEPEANAQRSTFNGREGDVYAPARIVAMPATIHANNAAILRVIIRLLSIEMRGFSVWIQKRGDKCLTPEVGGLRQW